MLVPTMPTLEDRSHRSPVALASSHRAGVLTRLQAWVQASRPAAYAMILVPLLLGQAFALQDGGRFSATYFAYACLFGVLYQVYLLYTNDHADAAIDLTNRQYWLSGGSRVLPEGKLTAQQLRVGAGAALAILVALTVYLAAVAQRPWMPVLLLPAVALCWAYNRPPLQWSYRGYGEVLQGLGCGVVLPVIGYYLQLGNVHAFPWPLLVPLYLVFYAGNLVTALPYYASDRAGGKRTFPVRHGQRRGRTTAVVLLAAAYLGLSVLAQHLSLARLGIIVIPSLLVLIGVVGSGLLRSADVADFPRCKTFVTWVSVSQGWFLFAWTGVLLAGHVP